MPGDAGLWPAVLMSIEDVFFVSQAGQRQRTQASTVPHSTVTRHSSLLTPLLSVARQCISIARKYSTRPVFQEDK
jgi:7,8-dihydro-6-hydroxymethylpterin-pyrophosphokinase